MPLRGHGVFLSRARSPLRLLWARSCASPLVPGTAAPSPRVEEALSIGDDARPASCWEAKEREHETACAGYVAPGGFMSIRRKGRYWEVLDNQEILVCLAVYRKGACEVVRRLEAT